MMHDFASRSITPTEAWEQGLQQGVTQVALNMLREGFELAKIVKLTGLSLEQVQHLQTNPVEAESQSLLRDFLEVSESAFSKIWLTPEEDEAWKNL